MTRSLLTPDELRRIADEKAREALEKKRKADDEKPHLHAALTAPEIRPDVLERLSKVVRAVAERVEREVMVTHFPSEWRSDGGRAIDNYEAGWPDTLAGFAKRAYGFGQKELEPRGLEAARADSELPGRDAGRCRHFPQVVNGVDRKRSLSEIGTPRAPAAGAYAARQQKLRAR